MEYTSIAQIIESDEFKEFIKEEDAKLPIPTGIALLDKIMSQGVPMGSLNMLVGKSDTPNLVEKFLKQKFLGRI